MSREPSSSTSPGFSSVRPVLSNSHRRVKCVPSQRRSSGAPSSGGSGCSGASRTSSLAAASGSPRSPACSTQPSPTPCSTSQQHASPSLTVSSGRRRVFSSFSARLGVPVGTLPTRGPPGHGSSDALHALLRQSAATARRLSPLGTEWPCHRPNAYPSYASREIPRWGHEHAPGDAGNALVAPSDGLPGTKAGDGGDARLP